LIGFFPELLVGAQDKKTEPTEPDDWVKTAIEDGSHIQYRKCAACGSQDMAPVELFHGQGLNSLTEYGVEYRCPDCVAQVPVRAPGALLAGGVYAFFWGAIGIWAFYQGPLWYYQHFAYFLEEYNTSFILLDLGAMAFYCGLIALALWIAWKDMYVPLKIWIQHPVTRENRAKSSEETAASALNLRMALMSLLVFPLLVWAVLLGAFWLLDAFGFDLRDNAFVKFAGMAFIFGASAAIGKRFNTNRALVFLGMVIWLVVFITILFTYE
jgi:hypothetical protein